MPKPTPKNYSIEELDRDSRVLARMLKIVTDGVSYLRIAGKKELTVQHTNGYDRAKRGLNSWSKSVNDSLQNVADEIGIPESLPTVTNVPLPPAKNKDLRQKTKKSRQPSDS